MKKLVIIFLALSLSSCGYILREVTGEGNPKCKPKCNKPATCRFEWTECSGPFGGSCTHSEKTVCQDNTK